jgi:hypothetical protein
MAPANVNFSIYHYIIWSTNAIHTCGGAPLVLWFLAKG